MHDRGQMPLLHGADAADPGARQDPGDLQVKIRRGQLDGIGRQYARVERVEPTGVPVVPRTLAHHLVSVDAIVARLGKGGVGDLVHADRARSRPVNLQGPEHPRPAPVGAHQRIARALDLRQRRQQLRRDAARGVAPEERPVLPPGLLRSLIEGAAHRKEQLRGLADDLVESVQRQRQDRSERDAETDAQRERRAFEPAQPAPPERPGRPQAQPPRPPLEAPGASAAGGS